MVYIDTSAAIKLFIKEKESDALRRYLFEMDGTLSNKLSIKIDLWSSIVFKTELICALRRLNVKISFTLIEEKVNSLLETVSLIRFSDNIVDYIKVLSDCALRTLDTIHVSTALSCGFQKIITYDQEMAKFLTRHGKEIIAPF